VINGQKTFGTAGHWCQWMIVLARTDPNVPKHAGISCFLVPLDSKGISMTPLYNVAGGRQNHTFFDNVRVPAESLLGTVNKAWEQVWFGMGGDKLDRTGPFIGDWGYRIMSHMKRTVRYCKETMRDGKPISEDPIVRQQLGDLLLIEEGIRMLWYEDFSNFINKKASPFGAAGRPFQQLVYKEYWPKMMQTLMEIVGPLAQIQGGPQSSKWAQLNGDIQYVYRCAFGNHAGGTSQLKRMVVATRGLGLPR
jgi:alkylation response protein AidB-like acyl-CoA dehydrogenase